MNYLLYPFVFVKQFLKYTLSYILKYLLYRSLSVPFLKLNKIDVFTKTIYFDFVYIDQKFHEYCKLHTGENKLVVSYFIEEICEHYKKRLGVLLSRYDRSLNALELINDFDKDIYIEHLGNKIVIKNNHAFFLYEFIRHRNNLTDIEKPANIPFLPRNGNLVDYTLRRAIQSQKTKIESFLNKNAFK